MWLFLFVLALIPLLFYWSDSVVEVFPDLKPLFPEKSSMEQVTVYDGASPEGNPTAGVPNKWYESDTEEGYLAWTVSGNGAYRLAVGCHAQAPAALQVTPVSSSHIPEQLTLNYVYGSLNLQSGYYAGDELVGATAQFGQLHLQDPAAVVLADFKVPAHESNSIARSLQASCAQ